MNRKSRLRVLAVLVMVCYLLTSGSLSLIAQASGLAGDGSGDQVPQALTTSATVHHILVTPDGDTEVLEDVELDGLEVGATVSGSDLHRTLRTQCSSVAILRNWCWAKTATSSSCSMDR